MVRSSIFLERIQRLNLIIVAFFFHRYISLHLM
jgi:hypothetical protein